MGFSSESTVPVSSALTVEQGADWRNYKRSLMQLGVLRTLMKDARGGLIR
jgi:hypothetical protein